MVYLQRVIFIFCLLVMPVLTNAGEPVDLLAMRIQPNTNETQITFILSDKTTGKVKYLPDKKQLLIDFANTRKRFVMQNARLGGSNVVSITSIHLPNQTVRFILNVNNDVKWTTRFTPKSETEKNASLLIDIISIKATPKPIEDKKPVSMLKEDIFALLAEHGANAKMVGRSRLEQQVKTALNPRKFTVVIDAGHGGKDTGAIGTNGTQEKTVVLAIAKRLARLINETPNMRAVLTRNNDYFVPLRQRMRLARKDEGDLFIAIHADAFFEKNARGASVYALSNRGATSEAARWLAQRDNYSELDDLELNALQDRSPVLRSVLIDMAQTATIRDSLRLGNRMLDSLDDISSLHRKHVEQAPFMVLRSPDIPSILIETGFISNPIEEKRLADPVYQEKLAQAILKGIQIYQ